jgi:hypothetical protein
MRTTGHKLEVKLLKEDLDDYRREIDEHPAGVKEALSEANADYFSGHVDYAIDVTRLGYLFDVPFKEIAAILNNALPDLQVVVKMEAKLDPGKMGPVLGAALWTRNSKIVKWLGGLPRKAYTDPDIEVSEILYDLVAAEQAGAREDRKAFDAAVKKLRPGLAPKKLTISPKEEAGIYGPVVPVLEAISASNQAEFDTAWKQMGEGWKKRFGRSSESANYEGILDLEGVGLALIAQKFGLKVPDTNPYVPADLLAAGEKGK